MVIRPIRPDEYTILGDITVRAYASLADFTPEPDYEAELRDVRGRAEAPATAVLVAADPDDVGRVVGGVTYVEDPSSPMAEHDEPNAAGIRMLAVDVEAQGRGVGEALMRACIERARESGRSGVVLHSTPWMRTAHRLYGRLGFERDPSLDWKPLPHVPLLGFRLRLET
jgi:predicted N-acetyltransferase YhbS